MKQHTNSESRRENRASTEQNLAPKMQRSSEELSGRNYDCGNSGGRQAHLFPELRGRDEVHQAALTDKLRSSNFEKKKTRSGLRQTCVRRPKRTRLRRRTNVRISRTWASCALLSRMWTRVSTKSTSSRHISRSCKRSSTHCMMRKIFKIFKRRGVQYPVTSQACRLFSEFFLSSAAQAETFENTEVR